MNSLIECFDEQSSPIIGEDVLVDSQGNIFNLPDLSATVQELLHKTSDNPKQQYKCQKTQEQKSTETKDNSRKETTGNIKLDDDSVGSDDTTTCSPPSDKHDAPFLNNTKTGKKKTVENEEKSLDGSAALLDELTPTDPMYGLPATAQFAPLLGWTNDDEGTGKEQGGQQQKEEKSDAGQ